MIILNRVMKSKSSPSRYYMFSRLNPRDDEYDLLVERCIRLDIFSGFRTVKADGVTRLVGFLIFKNGRVSLDAVIRALPNFLIIPMGSGPCPDESKGFTYFGGHPFGDIRRILFSIESSL